MHRQSVRCGGPADGLPVVAVHGILNVAQTLLSQQSGGIAGYGTAVAMNPIHNIKNSFPKIQNLPLLPAKVEILFV